MPPCELDPGAPDYSVEELEQDRVCWMATTKKVATQLDALIAAIEEREKQWLKSR